MNFITVQTVKTVMATVLLSAFFLASASGDCPEATALFVTSPREMEALSGSCLLIPCQFKVKRNIPQKFDDTTTPLAVWLKSTIDFANNRESVIYNSSRNDNMSRINLTGDLLQKNCTTLFSSLKTTDSDTYYFRIENGPFVATADCEPLQITVKDSPPKPRIEIPGELKEKQSVTITCSAFTHCPHHRLQLTWTLQQDPHNIREENTDGTFTTKIQETITLSDQHDGLNITCSARYPVDEGEDKTAEERTTLSVSYAPKDTSVSISPSGLVSAGSQVNLSCSSRAKPPVSRAKPPVSSFTWFKTSKDGDIKVSEGHFYSFNVSDDGGVYYCVATNDLGNETSSEIHLTIEGVKQLSSSWGSVVGGIIGIIVLICVVVVIWWLKLKHPTSKETQNRTAKEATRATEDIHYGEIDFSRQRPEASSSSEQDGGQQQETLYAQVKVSQTANSVTQTADIQEDLYAQVKKN